VRYRLDVGGGRSVEVSADCSRLAIVLVRNGSRLTVTLWSDGWLYVTWGAAGIHRHEREALEVVRALRRALEREGGR
jgi:hypothetical protein